jgi:WD40 repeat protein/ankyrin repeat protein
MSSSNKNKDKKQKKLYHKGGKVEGPVRHFRIAILDNKEIHRSEKGLGAAEATISMKANPVDAAKKLMSSICKHQGLKKMNRLKCNAIFWIRETTRNHSKIYGPYKGKFVNLMKNGKEKIVKLKTGAVIKYSLKPVVKKYKEKINESLQKKVNKMMKGGNLDYDEKPIVDIDTEKSIFSVATIGNGEKIVSGNRDGTINIWDSNTKKCIDIFPEEIKKKNFLEINTKKFDTNAIYDQTIKNKIGINKGNFGNNASYYQAIKNKIEEERDKDGPVYSLALSNNNSYIVSGCGGDNNSIKLWDIFSKQCLLRLNGHTAPVTAVAVMEGNKRIVSGSKDTTVKIWNMDSEKKCYHTFEGHTDSVNSIALIEGGEKIVSGSSDKTIKIWDVMNKSCVNTLTGHTGSVNSVAVISPDNYIKFGKIVSGSSDKTIKIWDPSSEKCIKTLSGHDDSVNSVAILHKEGRIVSGSSDNTVKIWESLSANCLQTLGGYNSSVIYVSVLENNNIVTGSMDETLKIWKYNIIENTTLKIDDSEEKPYLSLAEQWMKYNTVEKPQPPEITPKKIVGEDKISTPSKEKLKETFNNSFKDLNGIKYSNNTSKQTEYDSNFWENHERKYIMFDYIPSVVFKGMKRNLNTNILKIKGQILSGIPSDPIRIWIRTFNNETNEYFVSGMKNIKFIEEPPKNTSVIAPKTQPQPQVKKLQLPEITCEQFMGIYGNPLPSEKKLMEMYDNGFTNIDCKSGNLTALTVQSMRGTIEAMKFLLDKGANPDSKQFVESPLFFAISMNLRLDSNSKDNDVAKEITNYEKFDKINKVILLLNYRNIDIKNLEQIIHLVDKVYIIKIKDLLNSLKNKNNIRILKQILADLTKIKEMLEEKKKSQESKKNIHQNQSSQILQKKTNTSVKPINNTTISITKNNNALVKTVIEKQISLKNKLLIDLNSLNPVPEIKSDGKVNLTKIKNMLQQYNLGTKTPIEDQQKELIFYSAYNKESNIVIINNILIEKEIDINYEYNGITALIAACITGKLSIVKRLIKGNPKFLIRMIANNKKADINYVTKTGLTALKVAILFEHIDIVKELIIEGANVTINSPINVALTNIYNIVNYSPVKNQKTKDELTKKIFINMKNIYKLLGKDLKILNEKTELFPDKTVDKVIKYIYNQELIDRLNEYIPRQREIPKDNIIKIIKQFNTEIKTQKKGFFNIFKGGKRSRKMSL